MNMEDQVPIESGSIGTLAERLAALNDGELFLPASFLQTVVLPLTAASFVFVSTLYILALTMSHGLLPSDTKPLHRRKVSYQVTNFFTNIILGVCGLYQEYWLLNHEITEEEKTQNHEEFVFVSCFQLGYQIWAIAVGILYVNETVPMLVHHVSVIFVASMSGFLRNGFRYWTPFFYAVLEVSSIPLAVMNFFKDNPAFVKQYPSMYSAIRVIFAVCFLVIRIVMFVPRICNFLIQHYLVFSAHPLLPYRIFMSCCWSSSFFLLVLQVYWATLILKSIFKGSGKKKKVA